MAVRKETPSEAVFRDRSSTDSSSGSSTTHLLREYSLRTVQQQKARHKARIRLVLTEVLILALFAALAVMSVFGGIPTPQHLPSLMPFAAHACPLQPTTPVAPHQTYPPSSDAFLDLGSGQEMGWIPSNQRLEECSQEASFQYRATLTTTTGVRAPGSAPLFSALAAGCMSVEADIWPNEHSADGSPLVGHTHASLTPERTLNTLYIDPIMAILEHQNQPNNDTDDRQQQQHPLLAPRGIFDGAEASTVSLVLLLDFKTAEPRLWSAVQAQLQPLRDKGWLTHWDRERGVRVPRPVTVVATGDAPFSAIVNATQRDVFYDAPLDGLEGAAYDASNSHYASVSAGKAIGLVGWGLGAAQTATLRRQIRAAADAGLLSRYWGMPSWPVARRNAVWKDLAHLGMGVLNGDDVDCMAGMLSDRYAWERG